MEIILSIKNFIQLKSKELDIDKNIDTSNINDFFPTEQDFKVNQILVDINENINKFLEKEEKPVETLLIKNIITFLDDKQTDVDKKIKNYSLEVQNTELKNQINEINSIIKDIQKENDSIKNYLQIGENDKNLWDISWKSENLKFMNKLNDDWNTHNTLSLNKNSTVSINTNNYSGTSEQIYTLQVGGTIKANSTIYSENIITNSNNWNDSSIMEFVEFNNNNVLFKSGFLVDDLPEKLKQTRDGELMIRKNGIYQSTSLKGNFSIDSDGNLSIQKPFITNKDFKQGTLKMSEKLDIEKTKLTGSETIELQDNKLSLKLDGLMDTIQDKHIKQINLETEPNYKGIDIQKTNIQLSKDFVWSSSDSEKKLNDTLSIQPNFIRNKSATSQTLKGDLTIDGALTIIGNTTTINSTTLQVYDKHIELGKDINGKETDKWADGGGIILLGSNKKTILWKNKKDGQWESSENFNIPTNKQYRINDKSVIEMKNNIGILGDIVKESKLEKVGTKIGRAHV